MRYLVYLEVIALFMTSLSVSRQKVVAVVSGIPKRSLLVECQKSVAPVTVDDIRLRGHFRGNEIDTLLTAVPGFASCGTGCLEARNSLNGPFEWGLIDALNQLFSCHLKDTSVIPLHASEPNHLLVMWYFECFK